ncbi:MAG: Amino acid/amide ABC transporter ATP-binding protein 2, HAAT family [Synergistales bacterium 53_16]|jgi:branched-chain amino acid transport system ATP-binding protein|nr:MAG: Amino acid/amide ABC transporter ATP-binding protein 2, HAAT family [Synergistales bacterium 53_16]KUL05336.1 MAG: Amino acid/amide ABC transporter ATP-binding protein 2, HAAT family [Synergistales bacterium 54_9]MDK2845414.1 branched-chain amino acid transport system ATP-binding protein [Synergistales bacterium]MDN5336574.1 branched-chain amino acid transport system ATP-binding protein [Synergistales bacterium]HAG21762.1 branched-chain amino acid ABC transporter ATP-binding protein [Sy
MNDVLLKVENVHCGYGGIPVIHGVSLEVKEGEIVAIVGANGAGKTTTMRTIAGLMHPWKGKISFNGEDITHSPAHNTLRKGISYVPEGRRLFGKLTVRENLELGAFTSNDRSFIKERMEEVFNLFPILAKREKQLAETMSGGEQQMLAIARGLMIKPSLLMIDELSLGLMPALVEKVMENIVEINKSGTTILLVEQMVQEALEIAHRGYVIQTGRIVLSGTAKELLDSEEVRKAYLGM